MTGERFDRLDVEYLDPARRRRRAFAVVCRGCGTRLVVSAATFHTPHAAPDVTPAFELAERNATARPCCDLWRD